MLNAIHHSYGPTAELVLTGTFSQSGPTIEPPPLCEGGLQVHMSWTWSEHNRADGVLPWAEFKDASSMLVKTVVIYHQVTK